MNIVLNAYEFLVSILGTLALAFVILFVGLIAGKLLGKLLHRVLRDTSLDKLVHSATHVKIPLTDIIANGITYFIYFIAIIMALDTLQVATYVLKAVSVGIILLILLFMFLGLKDFIPNAIAGIILQKKHFLFVNDLVRVGTIEGKLVHMNLIESRVQTAKGDIIYIPNSHLLKEKVVKISEKSKKK
ncbi:MAG: mechanosensitive ion channel domain-containing protein [Candidatus Woesearchaeota archaeon]